MGERLKGKVAIVTGAGRGMGRAEALALAVEGASVVVNDPGVDLEGGGHDAGPADAVVAEIRAAGGRAAANYDNVTAMASGRRMVQQALDAFGRLDIVVNNAGIDHRLSFFDITEELWDLTIATHLKGHFALIQPAAEVFRRQGSGRIVNTSSLAGLGQPRHADYCAAKEGIAGLTRALAIELAPYGITVNTVRPRATTRMSQHVLGANAAAAGHRPPDRVAQLVVYLASDAAANISGRDFFVMNEQISLLTLPQMERTLYRSGGWDVDAIERIFPEALGLGQAPSTPAPQ